MFLKIKQHDTRNYYKRIGIGSTLENRRIQDMLITINSCFQGRAPSSIMNLINTRDHKYNLRGKNIVLLPKVNSAKHGLNSFKYYAAKQWNMLLDEARDNAGTKEFIHLCPGLNASIV